MRDEDMPDNFNSRSAEMPLSEQPMNGSALIAAASQLQKVREGSFCRTASDSSYPKSIPSLLNPGSMLRMALISSRDAERAVTFPVLT